MEGYGDRLARGATSAIFGPQDGKITQEKWDAAFEGYDPEEYKKEGRKKMAENLEIKKELVFDLHFIHGPRRVVGLTEDGQRFVRMFPFDEQFYKTAVECGLHVSFEDEQLRDRITGGVSDADILENAARWNKALDKLAESLNKS
jgi:hypothetical protein